HGLGMAVQVDEPGSDHTTRSIESDAPAEVGSDGGDARAVDRDVHGYVETLAGIDHAPAADHQRKFNCVLSPSRPGGREGAAGQAGGGTREQEPSPVQRGIVEGVRHHKAPPLSFLPREPASPTGRISTSTGLKKSPIHSPDMPSALSIQRLT